MQHGYGFHHGLGSLWYQNDLLAGGTNAQYEMYGVDGYAGFGGYGEAKTYPGCPKATAHQKKIALNKTRRSKLHKVRNALRHKAYTELIEYHRKQRDLDLIKCGYQEAAVKEETAKEEAAEAAYEPDPYAVPSNGVTSRGNVTQSAAMGAMGGEGPAIGKMLLSVAALSGVLFLSYKGAERAGLIK